MNPTAPASRAKLIEDANLVLPAAPFPWWLVGLVLGLGLAAAAGGWWYLHRRRARQRAGESAHTAALRELGSLRRRSRELSAHEYALQISGVLRVYIEARFGLRAPHRSTEEFLWEAERSPQLPPERRPLVMEFLRRCDQVKFALGDLSPEHRDALHEAASTFVQETAVRPEPDTLPVGGLSPGAPGIQAKPVSATP